MSSVEQVVRLIADTRLQPYRVTSTRQVEAKCPFPHPRPKVRRSFYVSLDTGLWLCHSCGRRGNLQALAESLGVEVDLQAVTESRQMAVYRRARPVHDELPAELVNVFLSRGPKVLLDAGFSKETLWTHQIGYDAELHRFTVPIWSRDGKLRAISGRALDDSQPKYLVYTRRHLVGLVDDDILASYRPLPKRYLWREHLVPAREALILCEGYKAAMWLAQLGYHSLALMSTSITAEQVDSLRRLEPVRIIIALDNDTAGLGNVLTVARKVMGIAPTAVFWYPEPGDGRSPDDLNEEEIDRGISQAVTVLKWRLAVGKQLRAVM